MIVKMEFYKLWYQFSISKDAQETFNTYIKFYNECITEELDIISSDKNMSINIPIFKDIMSIPNIKSIFKYPNLAFFNPLIVKNMQKKQRAPLRIDYSISFESNSARYLHDYMIGNKVNEENFVEILHTILDNNYNIDPMFYMLENFAKKNDSEEFYNNLISIKKLMTCDMKYYNSTKTIKSIYNDEEIEKIVEQDIAYFKNEFKSISKIAQKQHLIMKIILLMILIAKFKIKPRKKEEKFKEQLKYFIKFMDEKLKTIFLRELVVALNYLEYDNSNNKKEKKYRFFNKLNVGNKESLIKNVENMAWDFTLVRQLEILFSSKPNPNVDFFIPFIFTFDKGFLEVIENFYCKDFLIFHKEKRTMLIPENEFNLSNIEEYGLAIHLTEEAFNERAKNKELIDFEKIYENLLEEVLEDKRIK